MFTGRKKNRAEADPFDIGIDDRALYAPLINPDFYLPKPLHLRLSLMFLISNRSNENARQAGVSDRVQFIQQDLFQKVRGTIESGNETIGSPDMVLVGDRLSFEQRQKRQGQQVTIWFNGQANGNVLQGVTEVKTKTLMDFYNSIAKRQSSIEIGRVID